MKPISIVNLGTTLFLVSLTGYIGPACLAQGGFGDRFDMFSGGSGSSVQVSITNGVKTITATEGKQKIRIIEDPDDGIKIHVTRQYGPEDASALEKSHPELYMHLKSFPETVGDSKVELTVGVTTEYSAADKDELKGQHPEIFEVYKKYSNRGGFQHRLGGIPRIVLDDPAIEIFGRADDVRAKMEERIKELHDEIRKRAKEQLEGIEDGDLDLELEDPRTEKEKGDDA